MLSKKKEPIDSKIFNELKRKLLLNFITILDDIYPETLKKIANPPFVLFYKGDIDLINNKIVCMDGASKQSTTTFNDILIKNRTLEYEGSETLCAYNNDDLIIN